MRLGWLSAGVCALFVACGGSSHKRVLICDASVCNPAEEAGAAGMANGPVNEPRGDGGSGNESGAGPDGGAPPELIDAGSDAGAPSEGGVTPSSELEIALFGNGSVSVTNAAACLSGPCQYPINDGTVLTLEAKPGMDSRFVGWSGACAGSNPITTVTVSGLKQCVATFAIQRAVSVTVDVAGAGAVTTNPDLACSALGCSGQVDDKSNLTLNATPAAGFRFVRWAGSPECDTKTQPSLAIQVTENIACTAQFSKQFLLSVSAEGAAAPVSVSSGACSAASCTADAGASASFSAGPLPNFRFTGWGGDPLWCSGTANPLQVANIASDIACVANYAARLTVKGLVQSGLPGTVTATSGDVNATCYAGAPSNVCTLDSGKSTTLVAPTIANYYLSGWTGAGCTGAQSGNGLLVTPLTGDVTCTATYALGVSVTGTVVGASGTVSATSASPGADCTTPGSCKVNPGNSSVTLTAPNLLPAYRFVNWTRTGTGTDTGCTGLALVLTLTNVTSSVACQANYSQQFTILAKANPGGTATAAIGANVCPGNSCTVDPITSVTLTATPDTANGYHFAGWSGAGCTPAASNPLAISNVSTTCTASFALNTFTIAATAGTNGGVTATRNDTAAVCGGASCTVNFGTTVTLLATPAAHFHFVAWTGTGCTPAATASLTLKNLTTSCSAAFSSDTFAASVSATPAAAAAVSIACPANNCAAVAYGQPVNVTAVANAGWSFTGWSANCNGGVASPNTVTITGTTACVASFRPRVSAAVSPTGAGTIAATGTGNPACLSGASASCVVDVGGTVTLVATPAANAVFSSWSGSCAGTNPTVTLNPVNAPATCSANFYQLWAQATGSVNIDRMTDVTALADGTVVGLGTSVGARLPRAALVNLDANTGKLGRNLVVADTKGTGFITTLGLATTSNQKNIIAFGAHGTSAAAILPWLHNEQAPTWENEYSYTGGGAASILGGDVIPTRDGGYAFVIGILDAKSQITMAHLTKVDSAGNPKFDLSICGTNVDQSCTDTIPVDVLEDPAGKYFAVLSQTQTSTQLMITYVNEDGTFSGSDSYRDSVVSLLPTQFAFGPSADTFLVTGTRTDVKQGTSDGFYALFAKGTGKATYAFSLGGAGNENINSIAATSKGYALAGSTTDANGAQDSWLALIDQAGGVTAQSRYTGAGADYFSSVFVLPAGGLAVGGTTNSFGAGGDDMWTLRLDDRGAITFNAASNATRAATAYVPAPINLGSVANAPKSAPVAVALSAPIVTSVVPGFTQTAQAP